ncbi:MAG: choice-of-anchor Q domain-containing protein [bacterium]|nr:choice-of-anchor Q domain-containing protein [bacterium]
MRIPQPSPTQRQLQVESGKELRRVLVVWRFLSGVASGLVLRRICSTMENAQQIQVFTVTMNKVLRTFRWVCGLAWVFPVVQEICFSATFEVGPDKPYKAVRDAATACSPGDTIVVDPGIYVGTGALSLQPQCTLRGAGPGRTVLMPHWLASDGYALHAGRDTLVQGLWLCGGYWGGVDGSPWYPCRIENCVIWGNRRGVMCSKDTVLRNCIIFSNEEGVACGPDARATLVNTIVFGNGRNFRGELANISASYSCIEGGWPGEGNISADPLFARPEQCNMYELLDGPETYSPWPDFRLTADSPCLDAGLNYAELPETDIAGMQRIMFGGKSLTVDMGAYEFYINKLEPVPGTDEAVFTWSSLQGKTYSIFYSHDLFTWRLAIDNFPSFGNTTTSWTDDGSFTGLAPSLVTRRFYRLLENP